MMRFDVRCQVLEPIKLTDSSGREISLRPGFYRLLGMDHLVRNISDKTAPAGTDLSLIDESDGQRGYTIPAENLAHFISLDDVEVKF